MVDSTAHSLGTARRIVFMSATALVGVCAFVPFIATAWGAVAALVAVNLGLGVWSSMYLTLAQEVSHTHISSAAGTLSAFGSLVGALAMWAVGHVTNSAGDFTIPMVSVTVAICWPQLAGESRQRTAESWRPTPSALPSWSEAM